MELKRILANDTKSATEKAMALYGRNVLVISNHSIGGQTELVVAIDIEETAQGGSGDVLAGYLGGLLAQPQLQPPPAALRAMRYAVWQHGAAADQCSARGNCWTLEELLATLGNAA